MVAVPAKYPTFLFVAYEPRLYAVLTYGTYVATVFRAAFGSFAPTNAKRRRMVPGPSLVAMLQWPCNTVAKSLVNLFANAWRSAGETLATGESGPVQTPTGSKITRL